MELELTIKQAHEGLVKKEFSARELTQAFFDRIEEKDKEIKAFLTLTKESAFLQADQVDKDIKSNKKISVLAGAPLCIKDNILVEDIRCTAGSKILENYTAPYDATVIKKLKKEGAVILGKTNLDEFAMGSSTENSAFFATKNPHDTERVPGGSSGGSAAAVAANLALGALGSDTFGSIRQPSSFCGVVGLKPTYGAVSRYGLISMACSFDQIGPITKNVEDAKIVFDAIKGKDPLDSTSVESKFPISNFQFSNLRIGVPKEYFVSGIDEEVEELVKKAIKKFEQAGAKILEISLPNTEYAAPCYYIIAPCEISANLARYDGIRYGYSRVEGGESKIDNLLDVYLKSRGEGFGNEAKRRIMLGTYALSTGYYEAYYLRAQKVRTKVVEDFDRAFKVVDLIMTPAAPTPPFKIGEKIDDPVSMYLCDIFTGPVNLAGLPALCLPCGKTKDNLPVGLQIIGSPFSEERILKAGEIFEK